MQDRARFTTLYEKTMLGRQRGRTRGWFIYQQREEKQILTNVNASLWRDGGLGKFHDEKKSPIGYPGDTPCHSGLTISYLLLFWLRPNIWLLLMWLPFWCDSPFDMTPLLIWLLFLMWLTTNIWLLWLSLYMTHPVNIYIKAPIMGDVNNRLIAPLEVI